jgi:hypothetical protein
MTFRGERGSIGNMDTSDDERQRLLEDRIALTEAPEEATGH